MRIVVWHGWLLEGAGSNVYVARIVEAWRREGHDVLLLCQEPHPERFPFLDAWGTTNALPTLHELDAAPAPGRAVLLRPDIGDHLPVFVYDDYEGFRVTTFVDLTEGELKTYLDSNVTALEAATAWHRSELVIAGHAFPGPVLARRGAPTLPYVAAIHGSDVEYAVRAQPRYVELAREGLEGAAAIAGASRDVLDRLLHFVPSVSDRTLVVNPGVDAETFRPLPRRQALLRTAELLDEEPALSRGRTAEVSVEVVEALRVRDANALDELAGRYDQTAPDRAAPARLRALAGYEGPLVGYLGKLIPQKGVDHLITALALLEPGPRALIVGYGRFREWLEALVLALDVGDHEAVAFLRDRSPMQVDLTTEEVAAGAEYPEQVTFTGRLDHRYAATALAALDILVVPSILDEAFGMVALEGTAVGALPLVARQSGLAEVSRDLEAEIGEPGLLSYEPGPRAARNLADGLRRLLNIPKQERRELGRKLSSFVAERWGWQSTADKLLEAATGTFPRR